MTVKRKQTEKDTLYYNTFTCHNWLSLIEKANAWDDVYFWFNKMKEKYDIDVTGYVIMPNHVHSMLYLPQGAPDINTVLGNGKRFLAYDIVEGLRLQNHKDLIHRLHNDALSEYNVQKKQIHKVFIRRAILKNVTLKNSLYRSWIICTLILFLGNGIW